MNLFGLTYWMGTRSKKFRIKYHKITGKYPWGIRQMLADRPSDPIIVKAAPLSMKMLNEIGEKLSIDLEKDNYAYYSETLSKKQEKNLKKLIKSYSKSLGRVE